MTYTPGPWTWREPNGRGNGFLIERIDYCPRLPGAWLGSKTSDPEQLANVRLIVSAPELLEALEALRADYAALLGDGMTPDTEPQVLRQARAAIAKVRGE